MNRFIRRVAKYVIYYSPTSLKKHLQAYSDKKKLAEGMARMRRTVVSKAKLDEVLDCVDFGHDTMLHTSIINIGKVEGSVRYLTEQIIKRVDLEHNTLLVSALPYLGSFAEYLRTHPTFDVCTAPIAMGSVNERIAAMEGSCRSVHPTHSVVAIGRDSRYYTSTHHLDKTPFGVNSPYYKIVARGGHIVTIGATINNVTIVHVLEDILGSSYPVKQYAKERYTIDCTDAEGRAYKVETPVHDRLMGIRRDATYLLKDGLREGYIKQIPLGEAYVLDIDARRFVERQLDLLCEGKSLYGRVKRRNYREAYGETPTELRERIGR